MFAFGGKTATIMTLAEAASRQKRVQK